MSDRRFDRFDLGELQVLVASLACLERAFADPPHPLAAAAAALGEEAGDELDVAIAALHDEEERSA